MNNEGLLAVGARCSKNDDPVSKHPRLLHPDHHDVIALIGSTHEAMGHGGRGATLQRLRTLGVRIPRVRRHVDRIIRNCVTCRRISGKQEGQLMGDLPPERTESASSFTYVGCDVFSPMAVKESDDRLARSARVRMTSRKLDGLGRTAQETTQD